jgi:hypothetical protein
MPDIVQNCRYASSFEFVQLAAELLPQRPENMLGMSLLPFQQHNGWEIQLVKPNLFRGRMTWRGVGLPAQKTRSPFRYSGKVCCIEPGAWGNYHMLDEATMQRVAKRGTCGERFDLTDYEAELMMQIRTEMYNTVENLIWQVLANGYVSERNDEGQIVWEQRYNIVKAGGCLNWCDTENAAPISDLRNIFNGLIGVSGASFDFSNAIIVGNPITWECLFKNTNPADIGKMGLTACCDKPGMEVLGQYFAARRLPRPVIYDGFWLDENENVHFHVPTGKLIAVGVRPNNQRIGSFYELPTLMSCGNASENAFGMWMKRQDSACNEGLPDEGVRRLRWSYGINGAPVLEYPRAVVSIDTQCDQCVGTTCVEVC